MRTCIEKNTTSDAWHVNVLRLKEETEMCLSEDFCLDYRLSTNLRLFSPLKSVCSSVEKFQCKVETVCVCVFVLRAHINTTKGIHAKSNY